MLGVYSNTAGSAAFLSNQVYSPYGTQLFSNGNAMSQYTSKGFTGQYNDPISGLDYYVSRYYDPISGVFLSADAVQGNLAGLNPYAYAGGNPETYNDPSGQAFIPPGGGGGGGGGNTGGNSGSNGSGGDMGNSGGNLGSGGTGSTGYINPQSGSRENQLACQAVCKTGVNFNRTSITTVQVSSPSNVLATCLSVGGLGGFAMSSCSSTFFGGERRISFQQQETGTFCVPTIVCMDEGGGEEGHQGEENPSLLEQLSATGDYLDMASEGGGLAGEEGIDNQDSQTNEPTNPEQNFGRGTTFSHFTNAKGVKGITGVDPESLNVGQTVSVNSLSFGQGANPFMAEEPGDIFVTELGTDATARQLAQIGVLDEKQSFVIQFSQEAAIMNDIRTIDTGTGRSIFTIPGGSTLSGFDFLVTRLR